MVGTNPSTEAKNRETAAKPSNRADNSNELADSKGATAPSEGATEAQSESVASTESTPAGVGGSTGPKHLKDSSSRNAEKHGLFSKRPVLRDEDPAEYDQLVDCVYETLEIDNPIERLLAKDVADAFWKNTRCELLLSQVMQILRDSNPANYRGPEANGESDDKDPSVLGQTAASVAFDQSKPNGSFNVMARYSKSLKKEIREALNAFYAYRNRRIENEKKSK